MLWRPQHTCKAQLDKILLIRIPDPALGGVAVVPSPHLLPDGAAIPNLLKLSLHSRVQRPAS